MPSPAKAHMDGTNPLRLGVHKEGSQSLPLVPVRTREETVALRLVLGRKGAGNLSLRLARMRKGVGNLPLRVVLVCTGAEIESLCPALGVKICKEALAQPSTSTHKGWVFRPLYVGANIKHTHVPSPHAFGQQGWEPSPPGALVCRAVWSRRHKPVVMPIGVTNLSLYLVVVPMGGAQPVCPPYAHACRPLCIFVHMDGGGLVRPPLSARAGTPSPRPSLMRGGGQILSRHLLHMGTRVGNLSLRLVLVCTRA